MKHSKRILAYSAFALIVLLAAFAAIAPVATNVALAQGTVPAAPTGVTATSTGDTTIQISWSPVSGAATYVVRVYDTVARQTLTVGTVNHPTTTITHTGLTMGATYRYWVRGDNSDGGRGAYSNYVDEIAGSAPDRPANLVATAGYLQNAITWDAVSVATHYEIVARLSTQPNTYQTLSTDHATTSYSHTNLTTGETWLYWVRAVDNSDMKGLYAGPEQATVLAPPTVAPPTNFMAALGNTQITITWGDSPAIAGVNITGYEYRYRESGNNFPDTWTADAGADKTETITGLTNGTVYNFEVRATSSVGVGDPAMVSQTPATVPGVPTSFSASATHNSVMLTWGAPADNGGAQVSSYRIEFLDGQTWTSLPAVPSSRTDYTHSGRARSTDYQYRIYASNAAGEGTATSTSVRTLANAPQVPGAPTGVTATVVPYSEGGGAIKLTWTAPAFNGGSAVTEYRYRYKEAPSGSFGGYTSVGTMLEAEIDGLTPTKTYTFEVQARNPQGYGPAAETTSEAVASTAPTRAPNLVVSKAADTSDGDDQYRIEWVEVAAQYNGGAAIDNYRVQWKSDPAFEDATTDPAIDTGDWPADDADVVTDIQTLDEGTRDDGGRYSFLHDEIRDDTPLEPGTTYTYRVRAENMEGGSSQAGPWSAERSLTTPANIPSRMAAPTGESAAADTIKIMWTAPSDPGGAEITGYELQVRVGNATFFDDDGTGTGNAGNGMQDDDEDDNAGNALISNLPASRLEHSQTGVRTGVMYYYRVRAINSAGRSVWSEASAAVTTESAPTGAPSVAGTLSAGSPTADGSVTLTWSAPDSPGALPITHYEVQYQRVDDNDVAANNDADIADWTDAMSVEVRPPTTVTYTHMNADGGGTYHYRVRAVNGRGGGPWEPELDADPAEDAITVTFAVRDPSMPVLTAIATGMSDILLRWNIPASNGTMINGFQIQWWDPDPDNDPDTDNAAWANLGTDTDTTVDGHQSTGPADTQFTHSMRDAGTKYYYRIRALPQTAADGGWTAATMAAAVTATTDTGAPGRPTLMAESATGDDPVGKITLTWTAPTNDGGSEITGYDIEVLDISTRKWVMEASVAGNILTYTDENLEPGKAYYYILRAENSMGKGDFTPFQIAVAAVGVPDAPVLMADAVSRMAIELTWDMPDAKGATIVGYQIQQWNGTTYDDVTGRDGSNTVTVTEHTVTDLDAATKYYYRIRALTAASTGGPWSAPDDNSISGAASDTTHGDTPAAPADATFTVTAGTGDDAGTVTIEWVAPTGADIGGSAITNYSVQRYNSATGMWDEIGTPTAITYSDRGRTRGMTYYYRVAAVNAQGTGPYTAYKMAEIPEGTPDAPELTATPTGPRTIQLSWNIPADNGEAITGFLVQKWGDSDTITDGVQWGWVTLDVNPDTAVGATSGTPTQTFFVDEDVMPNTRYDYQISTETGNGDSDFAQAYATTHVGAPGRPMMVMATGESQTSIKLTWTAPSNNGSPIDRYEIWMWDTTSRSWGWNGVAGNVHTVRHPVTTFTHSGLTAGTQNIYRVRAVNGATSDNGGEGQWSTMVPGKTGE